MECDARLLQAVVLVRAVLARKGFFGRQVDKHGGVGQVIFERKRIDFADKIHAQTARVGLVGKRGVHVAVADDQFPLAERGFNAVAQVLRARRRV